MNERIILDKCLDKENIYSGKVKINKKNQDKFHHC